jgi:hypothetical protein
MKYTGEIVTICGAGAAICGFLASRPELGKYQIYAGLMAGVFTAALGYFAKGRNVTGGTEQQ